MMRKKIGLLIIVCIVVLGLSVFSVFRTQKAAPPDLTEQSALVPPREMKQPVKDKPEALEHRVVSKAEMEQIFSDTKAFVAISVQSLKNKFGADIHTLTTQLALMKFRSFMQTHYPDDWEAMFKSIIEQAFPERADAIFGVLAKMDDYNAWFETAKHELARMDYHDMKQRLWEKRRDLFAEAAEEIWKEEAHAEQVKDALAILNDSIDTSIDEKLLTFNEAASEGYADDEEFLQSKKYTMATAFLNLASVQQELAGMRPGDRKNTLQHIRQQLGYTHKEIEQMEAVDDRHEQSWTTGLAYMEDRRLAMETMSGKALNEKIAVLRQSYFGHRAQTIAKEEADGFFRYNRPRVYGRN